MSIQGYIGESKTPSVSVVMAAFNEEEGIDKAIRSIQRQTINDWELVIVDDGSSDRTREIVELYANEDSRIILVKNEENMGLPESLNRGIAVSRSDLIARADADDVNHASRLSKQVDFMRRNPTIDIVGTGVILKDKDGIETSRVLKPARHEEIIRTPFLVPLFFHPSVVIRRSFFNRVGGYSKEFTRTEDKELWLRGLSMGSRYANIPEALVEYNTNNFIRSWSAILKGKVSLFNIVKIYNIKRGYFFVMKALLMHSLVKLRVWRPRTVRKGKRGEKGASHRKRCAR